MTHTISRAIVLMTRPRCEVSKTIVPCVKVLDFIEPCLDKSKAQCILDIAQTYIYKQF